MKDTKIPKQRRQDIININAFKWQIKENYADLLELDVHLSKDLKIMVNHAPKMTMKKWLIQRLDCFFLKLEKKNQKHSGGGYKDSKTKENSLDAFKWQIKENYAAIGRISRK